MAAHEGSKHKPPVSSLTGAPSEIRLPAYTVPNPPLPSTEPTW